MRSGSSAGMIPCADQRVRVQLSHGRVLLDQRIHARLRVRRLVRLVVAQAPVPDQVDHGAAPPLLPVCHREPHGCDARLGVVGVHVDDRDVEALGEVGRVARRARLVGLGREPDLVVGDDVEHTAGGVAVEPLEIDGLGDDPLTRERGVPVDQQGQRPAREVLGDRLVTLGLLSAGATLDDRVDELEMARVARERDRDLLALVGLVGAGCALVVLDVAGAAARPRGHDVDVLLALELGQDLGVRPADRMRQHVQPPAVRHAHEDVAHAGVGGDLE